MNVNKPLSLVLLVNICLDQDDI